MGFSSAELRKYENATVPDLIGASVSLVFVGINPGLWTAATQTHFCHPSNRFYPALRRAGIIEIEVDTSIGMTEEQRRSFTEAGLGITNLVERATVRASDLGTDELRRGALRLEGLVRRLRPSAVAVAGVTAYRTGFAAPKAEAGLQPSAVGGVETWVVPNPSGLNAHETVDTLAIWYRKAAQAAGLL